MLQFNFGLAPRCNGENANGMCRWRRFKHFISTWPQVVVKRNWFRIIFHLSSIAFDVKKKLLLVSSCWTVCSNKCKIVLNKWCSFMLSLSLLTSARTIPGHKKLKPRNLETRTWWKMESLCWVVCCCWQHVYSFSNWCCMRWCLGGISMLLSGVKKWRAV